MIVSIYRKGSHNPGRNTQNMQEVTNALRRRYGDRLFVFQGPMHLNHSLHIFGRTRLMLGVHGGAMYNLHFAPQETVVVEYIGTAKDGSIPSDVAHTIIWRLAQNAGQTYYRVAETPLNSQLDINIDIATLVKLLDRIDRVQLGEKSSPV